MKTFHRYCNISAGPHVYTGESSHQFRNGAILAYQYIDSRKDGMSENPYTQMDATEMFRRGLAYEKGDGIEQDYSKALTWYTKAAEAGNADAMNNIGCGKIKLVC